MSDVLHWLIDHVTRDGSVAPEKVAELHAAVDDEASAAAGQATESAPTAEPDGSPAAPDPEPELEPDPAYPPVLTGPAPTGAQMAEPPGEVTPDASAQ